MSLDPDHLERLERTGSASQSSGLRIEFDGVNVTARSAWLGSVTPRTPPPALTGKQVRLADAAARTLLEAEPGELVATKSGGTITYRRPTAGGRVV